MTPESRKQQTKRYAVLYVAAYAVAIRQLREKTRLGIFLAGWGMHRGKSDAKLAAAKGKTCILMGERVGAQSFEEKAFGTEHPLLAMPLSGIGTVLFDQGKLKQALEPLERAVKICKKMTCQPIYQGRALFYLAQVLVVTGGDKPSSRPKGTAGRRTVQRERVIKLATQAREVFEKIPKRFKKELEEVNTWLQKHGAKKLAKKVSP